MDDSVKNALEAAVAADPTNVALRSHLAQLLMESNDHEGAWEHAVAGLTTDPANIALLRIASGCGDAAGHPDEAAAYRTLADALTGKDSNTPNEPTKVTATGPVPDSVDDLLDIWDENEGPAEPTVGEISRDRLLLADVGGMEEVKQRLHTSFLNPMRNPEMQAAFGKSMRGGLLLWGPPGCGKTFIAKAVAGELDANFYSVGLSDILDMYMGSSEQNIANIFDIARRNTPCVLFLDEVDAIGMKRTQLRGGGGSAMRGVVNQLLQEMDGANKDNEGVFVLAATNHPWDVDSALLRPGRFDRSLLVLPPDEGARAAILELHLRDRPTENVDFVKCARSTDGLSGADLALVAEQATELAMEQSIAKGSIVPITMKHLAKAIKATAPSYGPWVDSARNFAMFNNESGQYDDLINWLSKNKIR